MDLEEPQLQQSERKQVVNKVLIQKNQIHQEKKELNCQLGVMIVASFCLAMVFFGINWSLNPYKPAAN